MKATDVMSHFQEVGLGFFGDRLPPGDVPRHLPSITSSERTHGTRGLRLHRSIMQPTEASSALVGSGTPTIFPLAVWISPSALISRFTEKESAKEVSRLIRMFACYVKD